MLKKLAAAFSVCLIIFAFISASVFAANEKTSENPNEYPIEMFFGSWIQSPALGESYKNVTDFSFDAKTLNDGDAYAYKIIKDGVRKNPEELVKQYGEGYFLEVVTDMGDGVKNANLFHMETPWSEYVYTYSQFYGGENDERGEYDISYYGIRAEGVRSVNYDRKGEKKRTIGYQVGDSIQAAALMVFYTGTVTAVDGNYVEVYWQDIVDPIWEFSMLDSMTDSEIYYQQQLTGRKLFATSWIDKADISHR